MSVNARRVEAAYDVLYYKLVLAGVLPCEHRSYIEKALVRSDEAVGGVVPIGDVASWLDEHYGAPDADRFLREFGTVTSQGPTNAP